MSFERPSICIVKHLSPCGIASADALAEAYRAAFECDKVSAFGGVIDSPELGRAKADYARCVKIVTAAAQKEMIAPSLMAIISPVLLGFLAGIDSVAGMLMGATVSGFVLAIMMANSGGAWDNAKKYIEGGEYGGKGSGAHKAAVVGDTVGDPFKDTSGPSLNILIKLMAMVSVVFASFVIRNSLMR